MCLCCSWRGQSTRWKPAGLWEQLSITLSPWRDTKVKPAAFILKLFWMFWHLRRMWTSRDPGASKASEEPGPPGDLQTHADSYRIQPDPRAWHLLVKRSYISAVCWSLVPGEVTVQFPLALYCWKFWQLSLNYCDTEEILEIWWFSVTFWSSPAPVSLLCCSLSQYYNIKTFFKQMHLV